MCPGQLRHRRVVGFDLLQRHRSRVARNIIRPRQNYQHRRLQVDHVLAEPDKHLWRCLSANSAIDVRLAGEVLVQRPAIGNGISKEHHALFSGSGRFELRIGIAVARQFTEIVPQLGVPRAAPSFAGLNRAFHHLWRHGLIRRLTFRLPRQLRGGNSSEREDNEKPGYFS